MMFYQEASLGRQSTFYTLLHPFVDFPLALAAAVSALSPIIIILQTTGLSKMIGLTKTSFQYLLVEDPFVSDPVLSGHLQVAF